MLVFSEVVDYRWARERALAQFRAGVLRREEICDAEFLLKASAEHHGKPALRPCPICSKDELRIVTWVYGDSLGRASGSARSVEEASSLIDANASFTVHEVEVCPQCSWNHLLHSRTATKRG